MESSWISTACQGCLSNCALRVRREDGRITGIRGNEAAATNHGSVCPNTRLAFDQTQDPDRVRYPLRRTNPKKGRLEDPGWKRISLDEALDEIAARMVSLRDAGKSHELAILKGRSTGIGSILTSVLPKIYGTPNSFNHDSICAEAKKVAYGALTGRWEYPDYDLENTRFALLWGADPIASGRRKGHAASAWGKLCGHARAVVIDPRRSSTAERANEWVCVTPGEDAALALAMAHVVLFEGLWNREFVGDFPDGINHFASLQHIDESLFSEKMTRGIVSWWNEELLERTPEWAEPRCGVAAADIRRLARQFAACGSQAVSWISTGVAMTPNGAFTALCCFALNGLVGSMFAKGGVFFSPAFPTGLDLPSVRAYQDESALAALQRETMDRRGSFDIMSVKKGKLGTTPALNTLPEAILAGEPYPLRMLVAYWVNPAFSCTGAIRWEHALAKLPFFVCLTSNLSETCQFADIVLPAKHHAFETWGFVRSCQNRASTIALEQPCTSSAGEALNDEAGFAFLLAQKLADHGFPAFKAYFEREIVDPCTGLSPTTGDEAAECCVKLMTRSLWDVGVDTPQDAWDRFREAGIWNAPRDDNEKQAFATNSGRFEFCSSALRRLIREHASANGLTPDELARHYGWTAQGQALYLPHYEEPLRIGSPEAYPFLLSEHKSRFALEGRSANLPRFQEWKAHDPGDVAWDDVVKINPVDMEQLGLSEGDTIRVTSAAGSIQAHAKSWDGTRAGTVVKCYGQGHWAYGHTAALDFENHIPRGGNNNELYPPVWEHISGTSARNGGFTRVRIEKA